MIRQDETYLYKCVKVVLSKDLKRSRSLCALYSQAGRDDGKSRLVFRYKPKNIIILSV